MTTETVTVPSPTPVKDTKPKPFIRERSTEEPRGRWDNRCTYTHYYGFGKSMACDRRTGHRGLHHGRMFDGLGNSANAVIIGWVTVLR